MYILGLSGGLEEWRDVIGYEGLYQVSNYGRVINIKTKHIKSQYLSKVGYRWVLLYKHNKGSNNSISRLVAIAFIPNPENKPQVNHKDLDRMNNNVDNLEWVTRKENINHAINNGHISSGYFKKGNIPPLTKLNIHQVEEIRKMYNTKEYTYNQIGKKYDISRCHVWEIISHKCWRSE